MFLPRCNRQVFRLCTFYPSDFVCRFLFSSPGRRERRRDLEGIYICINETVVVEILVVLCAKGQPFLLERQSSGRQEN